MARLMAVALAAFRGFAPVPVDPSKSEGSGGLSSERHAEHDFVVGVRFGQEDGIRSARRER